MWSIVFHPLVVKEDFKIITPQDKKLIFKHIMKKLSIDPEAYGKPLSGALRGYWRLRIEDFRAIYQIHKDTIEVLIIKVGIRRDMKVYEEFLLRLKKLRSQT